MKWHDSIVFCLLYSVFGTVYALPDRGEELEATIDRSSPLAEENRGFTADEVGVSLEAALILALQQPTSHYLRDLVMINRIRVPDYVFSRGKYQGWPLFCVAAALGNAQHISYLLGKEAVVERCVDYGRYRGCDAINIAAVHGNCLAFRLFVERFPGRVFLRVLYGDFSGWTNIHLAGWFGHWPIIEYLAQINFLGSDDFFLTASISQGRYEGWNLFHIAAYFGYHIIAREGKKLLNGNVDALYARSKGSYYKRIRPTSLANIRGKRYVASLLRE